MTGIPVTHYGLHWHDNMAFLHQQDGGRCVTAGLDGLESPLVVETERRWARCPHHFTETEPGPILDHPMVRAMGPAQEAGFFYVLPEHEGWLWQLAKMSRAVGPVILPLWTARPEHRDRWLADQLVLTNLTPLTLVDTTVRDVGLIARIARAPRVRNLVVSGPMKPPEAIQLDPAGLPADHDWPAEGRRQLHHLIHRSQP